MSRKRLARLGFISACFFSTIRFQKLLPTLSVFIFCDKVNQVFAFYIKQQRSFHNQQSSSKRENTE